MLFAMGLENPLHIAILLIIILLVFGAKRLPEMGRSLGSGMREFKDSLTGSHRNDDEERPLPPPAEPAAAQPAAPAPAAAAPPAPTPSVAQDTEAEDANRALGRS
jgi:sec-independent protein translocase protein TatA